MEVGDIELVVVAVMDNTVLPGTHSEDLEKLKEVIRLAKLGLELEQAELKRDKFFRPGTIWKHYTGKLYQIRGISKFSFDGELDGAEIVEYETLAGTQKFTTTKERFLTKFERPS